MPIATKDQLIHISSSIYVFAYALAACVLVLFTVYLCYALEWRGPMRDMWEFIGLIEQQLNGQWNWQALIEPYGGIHRLLLPKLMFYLDYRFFAGTNIFSLTLTLLLHISSAAIAIWSIVNFPALNKQEKTLLSAMSLLFFFSTTQIYNLIYNSDNQVVISHAIAIYAARLFSKEKIISAHLLVLVASLSHSSSLMLFPAMSILLMAQSYPRRYITVQILISLIILLIYVGGSDPLNTQKIQASLWQKISTSIFSFITQIDGIFRYIGLHLSSPTSRLWPTLGIAITYLSLVYLCSYIFRLTKRKMHLHSSELFWLTLAFYVFFVALVTAYGRQFYPNSALTDRYQTIVMSYWFVVLILLYLDLKRYARPFRFAPPLLAIALLLPHQLNSATELAWLSSRVTRAHTAAIVGITDMETIAATLSHPLLMDNKNLVEKYNNFLRKERLGYFSYSDTRWFLNEKNNLTFNEAIISDKTCSAEIFQLTAISTSAYKIEGKASVNDIPTSNLLFINSENQVIGFARAMRNKAEFKPLHWRDPSSTQWAGFIQSDNLSPPIRIIGRTSAGYCEFLQFNLSATINSPR